MKKDKFRNPLFLYMLGAKIEHELTSGWIKAAGIGFITSAFVLYFKS